MKSEGKANVGTQMKIVIQVHEADQRRIATLAECDRIDLCRWAVECDLFLLPGLVRNLHRAGITRFTLQLDTSGLSTRAIGAAEYGMTMTLARNLREAVSS